MWSISLAPSSPYPYCARRRSSLACVGCCVMWLGCWDGAGYVGDKLVMGKKHLIYLLASTQFLYVFLSLQFKNLIKFIFTTICNKCELIFQVLLPLEALLSGSGSGTCCVQCLPALRCLLFPEHISWFNFQQDIASAPDESLKNKMERLPSQPRC